MRQHIWIMVIAALIITSLPISGYAIGIILSADMGWTDESGAVLNGKIGTWDAVTKTAFLTSDIQQTITIQSNGITLNGNGHVITGCLDTPQECLTEFGIQIDGLKDIKITNIQTTSFRYGILIRSSREISIVNCSASKGIAGISLDGCTNCQVISNNFNDNDMGGIFAGLQLPVYYVTTTLITTVTTE